jgi:predicted aspartyl protease
MNKHTKELFDKALDQAVPETWTTLSHEQMMKLSSVFSELLIKACAELCETEAYAPRLSLNPTPAEQYAFRIGQGTMAVNLAKQIRKHFGVEQ